MARYNNIILWLTDKLLNQFKQVSPKYPNKIEIFLPNVQSSLKNEC